MNRIREVRGVDDTAMTATYLSVMILEAAILVALVVFGRLFSYPMRALDWARRPRVRRLDRLRRPAPLEGHRQGRGLLSRPTDRCRGGPSGLSVMATQMSAVTMVGTTGQAYATGLRFVQFYFGLPLAMVILS